MKKIIYLLLVSLFVFTACNQEDEIIDVTLKKGKPDKVTICHYNPHNDTYKTISVNEKQLAKHLEHGDSRAPCGYTYVPDDVFEQQLIDKGYDDVLDDLVLTTNINTIEVFNLNGFDLDLKYIQDLTGLEDFTALTRLTIFSPIITDFNFNALNSLTYFSLQEYYPDSGLLNLSSNSLTSIYLGDSRTFSLDCTNIPLLERLVVYSSTLSDLNVSNNLALQSLNFSFANQFGNNPLNLDLSNNPSLTQITISDSNISRLNLKNGNNKIINFYVESNYGLTCIQVDDAAWSTANWTDVDPGITFSEDCGY